MERPQKNGAIRYTGMYKAVNGKYKSAGTFDDQDKAREVALAAEKHAASRLTVTSPAEKAKITVRQFFWKFLDEHGIEPGSKMNYAGLFRCHVDPYIGDRRLIEVDNEVLTQLLTVILAEEGAGHSSIAHTKTMLSSMFGLAKRQRYITGDNPVAGIRLTGGGRSKGKGKIIKVYDPPTYNRVRQNLPSLEAKRFSLLIFNSGVRFCEAISFVEGDLNYETGRLEVTKSTVEITSEFHPDGERFLTKNYTKNGTVRVFTIDLSVARALKDHVDRHGIKRGELLFPYWMFESGGQRGRMDELTQEELDALGTFEAKVRSPRTNAEHLRTFKHGTLTGYATGKCGCVGCKQASRVYGRERMAKLRSSKRKKAPPPMRLRGNAENLSKNTWRRIWVKAVAEAGVDYIPPYDIRHCHASNLLRGGEDLATVQARLGHNDIHSTTRYLTVIDQESTSSARIMGGFMQGWEDL
ncbi:tyrosine-type recombinase/integrase [Sphaerisporangium sp. NPDC051017]|uniref:tyrosine-type recombinase/integrase n=1 Tax=unclassified Sphaerisporangium TaxID=2630420 RepID=UPI0033CC4919